MWSILLERFRQGHRTLPFPPKDAVLGERFCGRVTTDPAKCQNSCDACASACPTEAISVAPLRIDLGACLFCAACRDACPQGAIDFSRDYRLAAFTREELLVQGREGMGGGCRKAGKRTIFNRSLKLRQVSAGGCNACEADLQVLGTVAYDLGRFGIQFVASPRHADGIVVTGPVTRNMVHALKETYDAVPEPKVVIAVGACAISGGVFASGASPHAGVPREIPVDLFIPGCPPHPFTLLDGLLRLTGRLGGGVAD